MMEKSNFEWLPNAGVGKFRFGVPVHRYIQMGMLDSAPDFLTPEVSAQYSGGLVELFVFADEKDMVEDIICRKNLHYKGQNLIGLHVDQIIGLIGEEPDELPTHVVDVHIPGGKRILSGIAAPQRGWGRGGGLQFHVPDGSEEHWFGTPAALK